MAHIFCEDLERETLMNTDFHRVLHTGKASQLVLMCLQPNEDIGLETHAENDQFFRICSGIGKAIVGDAEFELSDGMAVTVPMGTPHNIINTSTTDPLQLYTIYSPPHLPEGTVHATKADHEAGEGEDD